MTLASLLLTLAKLIGTLTDWARERSYISQGQTDEIAKELQNYVQKIALAKLAGDGADKHSDAGGLHDDDGFKRKRN